MPELALTEQMIELGRRHINQEQYQYPKLDCDKAIPGKGRYRVRYKSAEYIMSAKPISDPMFEQADDEDRSPIKKMF